jgi:hypothetical protein
MTIKKQMFIEAGAPVPVVFVSGTFRDSAVDKLPQGPSFVDRLVEGVDDVKAFGALEVLQLPSIPLNTSDIRTVPFVSWKIGVHLEISGIKLKLMEIMLRTLIEPVATV